jgi:hypothetical protein
MAAGNKTCTCGSKVTGQASGNANNANKAGKRQQVKAQKRAAKVTRPRTRVMHSKSPTVNQAAARNQVSHAKTHICHCSPPIKVKRTVVKKSVLVDVGMQAKAK